jgi:SSS family solute:Na+ symporter
MLAGFFMQKVSAVAAKSALIFGLLYYIITTFILQVDIHFIHNWGIEFVLNVIIMYAVSYFYPRKNYGIRTAPVRMEMIPWKYARHLSAILVVVTILIYILLGRI